MPILVSPSTPSTPSTPPSIRLVYASSSRSPHWQSAISAILPDKRWGDGRGAWSPGESCGELWRARVLLLTTPCSQAPDDRSDGRSLKRTKVDGPPTFRPVRVREVLLEPASSRLPQAPARRQPASQAGRRHLRARRAPNPADGDEADVDEAGEDGAHEVHVQACRRAVQACCKPGEPGCSANGTDGCADRWDVMRPSSLHAGLPFLAEGVGVPAAPPRSRPQRKRAARSKAQNERWAAQRAWQQSFLLAAQPLLLILHAQQREDEKQFFRRYLTTHGWVSTSPSIVLHRASSMPHLGSMCIHLPHVMSGWGHLDWIPCCCAHHQPTP